MKHDATSRSHHLRFALLAPGLAALLALAVAGCGATKPGSASFAAVTIHGHSAEEIAGGTMGKQIVFQKEGSRMTNLAYEGLVGTHEGAQTLVRVKMDLVKLGPEAYRLQCQAYIVRGAGDAFFEQEQRLANIRSGPYQSLLNQVAKQLK